MTCVCVSWLCVHGGPRLVCVFVCLCVDVSPERAVDRPPDAPVCGRTSFSFCVGLRYHHRSYLRWDWAAVKSYPQSPLLCHYWFGPLSDSLLAALGMCVCVCTGVRVCLCVCVRANLCVCACVFLCIHVGDTLLHFVKKDCCKNLS